MTETGANAYDAVAYPAHAFSQTHPARLATIAHAHGMRPPPLAGMRVLELGCGRGANLIPMAGQYPAGHFVGVDLSLRAIEAARSSAAELGLGHIHFEHLDIMAVTPALGEFDYIIAHGVYSWVPAPVRDSMLAIFGSLLSAQGVAYVSYNALPGCRIRDIARDVMLFETRDVEDPEERVRRARLALKRFADAADPDSFHGAALRMRQSQVEEIPDDVLYHDDLNPQARAFALHEVLEDARRHGLQFLAESAFPNQFGAAREPAQQLLAQIPIDDRLAREQALDLVIGRFFRETLLCRADILLRPGSEALSLKHYHLSADVRRAAGDPDARPGVEQFSFGAVQLAIDLPIAKAALARLEAAWPGSIAHDVLARQSASDIGLDGSPDLARELGRLDDALMAIFRAGLLDIQLEPLKLTTTLGERPVASALARVQARTTQQVTNLRHRTVVLDDIVARKFLCVLDGSRDQVQLLDEMNVFLAQTRTATEGLPERATAQDIQMRLRDVARLALLSG
ncbi:methyltransferase regulatory domain-containing protein [Bosea sp. PAMC 26642]|uniref:methyltransferase regulatory domain-containing protein n=1 Tax=Bosea sp. (strain PAMC 26642) TaxID=1792307 RepID=UPI000A9C9C28|nr:methyltransferase regulatory domain-containing protein [Bosea sp. PAMC 26642]